MDPFNGLPVEMQREILLSVLSKESMNSLIRASPTLFQSYIPIKTRITRNILAADLDDEMVQHAVAIIQFPLVRGSLSAARHPVAKHLTAWHNRQLPNPLQHYDPQLFNRLDKLHSLIFRLIQDYITKATSRFPPRQFLCLPQIDSSTGKGHLIFRGQENVQILRTDSLTDNEKKRFLKAFLLYELNCKTIKRVSSNPPPRTIPPRPKIPTLLVSQSEDDAVRCIHTYVCSLHGAIAAQCGDAWLPNPPTDSSLEPGLLFPDNFFLDPNIYIFDLGLGYDDDDELAAEFAKSGLELLVEFLGHDISDPSQKEALLVRIEEFWDSSARRRGRYHHAILKVSPRINNEAPMYHELGPKLSPSLALQEKVFEQRAWIFFDNFRMYPLRSNLSHFPVAQFLLEEPDKLIWFGGWKRNSDQIRAKCRSQEWHHRYLELFKSGETEEDQ
ncbi:hypothetical protein IL306_013515 [Fusarium sp. DS 682]|nr:hypothetical protein IL306_013515 [Fusarium sp. DS 682]